MPFGVLTRKALAKQAGRKGAGSLSLASAAPANGKWSRQHFAQATEMLRQNAVAILISDPQPDWLTSKGIAKWGQMPISFVRYETTLAGMRDVLGRVGARPIGRRGEDGVPNIDFLIDKESAPATRNGISSMGSVASGDVSAVTARNGPLTGRDILAVSFDGDSEIARREIFDTLMLMTSSQVTLTIKLPADGNEEDRRRLMDLGFSHLRET